MKEKFIQFLKDNNCLERFEANLKSDANLNDQKTIGDLLRTRRDPIGSAFVWDDTPEGWKFWHDIHLKYHA